MQLMPMCQSGLNSLSAAPIRAFVENVNELYFAKGKAPEIDASKWKVGDNLAHAPAAAYSKTAGRGRRYKLRVARGSSAIR